jgi:hypothetical protein
LLTELLDLYILYQHDSVLLLIKKKGLRNSVKNTVVLLVQNKYTRNFPLNIKLNLNHNGIFTEFPRLFVSVYGAHISGRLDYGGEILRPLGAS